jgi:hypothetical protein
MFPKTKNPGPATGRPGGDGARIAITRIGGDRFLSEAIGNELIVFDQETHKAHLLNSQAAAIWRAAESGCSLDEVETLTGASGGEATRHLAALRVSELVQVGLVKSDLVLTPRRDLLKALGTLAAGPGIVTILAPKAEALISSCTRNITACASVGTNASDCCAAAPDCRTIIGGVNTGTNRCCVGGGAQGTGTIVLLNPALCCSGAASILGLDLICQP